MDQAAVHQLLSIVQYPQFTMKESVIARAWLAGHAAGFDSIEFNPLIGSAVELGPEFDAVTRAQAAALSRKRADIVAHRGPDVTIVEVKERVSLSALGQLIGYEYLWRKDHPGTRDVALVAIGQSALVDIPEVFAHHSITVELFPNVFLAPLPSF